MEFKPYPYQAQAIKAVIKNPKIGLFLDMGLGKSIITLTAIEDLMHNRVEVRRVLIIAPKKVAESTWTQEAKKWDHTRNLTFSKVLGSQKERLKALKTPADIYVINRENVKWLVDYCVKQLHWWPFDMVVIDELSSFKNHQSKRFRALRKIQIPRVVGLTGTPAANSLLDLWAEMYLIDHGERLGKTYSWYRDHYFVPDKRSRQQIFSYRPRSNAMQEITQKISDITITMRAEDYLQLPEIVYNDIPVELEAKDLDAYRRMEKEQLLAVQDILTGEEAAITALQAGAVMNKLLQIANGFVYDENKTPYRVHTAKLEALQEIYEAQKGHNNLLVFYNFQADKDAILTAFPEARLLDNDQDVQDWNAGKIPMLLAHPASVGYGLNLQQGGHIVIWYSLTWSLELYQQANARLHRQGQTERVIIAHLVAQNTVDEAVSLRLHAKDQTQNALLDILKFRIKGLDSYDS